MEITPIEPSVVHNQAALQHGAHTPIEKSVQNPKIAEKKVSNAQSTGKEEHRIQKAVSEEITKAPSIQLMRDLPKPANPEGLSQAEVPHIDIKI